MKNTILKILFLSLLYLSSCVTPKKVVSTPIKTPEIVVAPIEKPILDDTYGFDSENQKKWVDSVYNQMTFDERVGQLFMVSAYSNKDSVHANAIDKLIQEHKIGGLIFFKEDLFVKLN
ncbi:hypothetical protein ACFQZF_13250 [Flavobacterium myungsuense]|uniref:hypothetical protein n=1 Tax=Flavobacterium myungsuense TaxID=651823 RepID=UPI00364196AC